MHVHIGKTLKNMTLALHWHCTLIGEEEGPAQGRPHVKVVNSGINHKTREPTSVTGRALPLEPVTDTGNTLARLAVSFAPGQSKPSSANYIVVYLGGAPAPAPRRCAFGASWSSSVPRGLPWRGRERSMGDHKQTVTDTHPSPSPVSQPLSHLSSVRIRCGGSQRFQ